MFKLAFNGQPHLKIRVILKCETFCCQLVHLPISVPMRSKTVSRHPKRQCNTEKSPWRKVPRTVGLYQYLPSQTYYAKLRAGGSLRRESLKTTDLAFAKRKLETLRNRLRRTDPGKGRMTLVTWLENYYAPTLCGAPGAVAAKKRIIARVKREWVFARTQPMREIKESQVLAFLNRQYGGWSVSYWNSALTVIRDAFQMAVRDHVLLENPAGALKYRKRSKPIRLTPSYAEFKQIVADIRSQKFNGHEAEQSADFIEFCGAAGLGQAEVAAITRAHVDLASNQILVHRHKTGTGFAIPIYPQLRSLVERSCEGKRPNEYIFQINQARAALRSACQRLHLPPYTHRSLRRMFVTRCLELGIDVQTVARWQGHRDSGQLILQVYGHVRAVHSQRMAQLLTEEEAQNVVPMRTANTLS
jgi:integrase